MGRGSSKVGGRAAGGSGALTPADYIGAGRRWQKNGKDRVYFEASEILGETSSNGIPVRNYFNRYERQNLSVYYDVNAKKLVITNGDSDSKKEVERVVEDIVRKKK